MHSDNPDKYAAMSLTRYIFRYILLQTHQFHFAFLAASQLSL